MEKENTRYVVSTYKPNVKHPEYKCNVEKWMRCCDAYEGTDAIKARGEEYLPRLSKQIDEDYKAYKRRALFYGATERTVQGLSGAAVYKPFEVEIPPRIKYLEDDATRDGLSLQQFIKKVVTEVLKVGRVGVLVDRLDSDDENNDMYFAKYEAHEIINWYYEDGKPMMIMLEEKIYEESEDNPYEVKEVLQWRELVLENGVYFQRLWHEQKDDRGASVFVYEEIPILQRGKSLNYIPWVFINATGISECVSKPPLLSVVDVNISHYQNSADLEHGRHFTGLPTPWVKGVETKPGEQLRLGSQTAWTFPGADAACGYLEFTGAGLTTLERALESKERMMAVLGARLLDNQKAAPEAEGTLRIRNMGDTYTLSGINIAVADALTLLLSYASIWESGTEEGVSVTPNTDFADTSLSSGEITALVGALNSGAISLDTFLWNMKVGERLAPNVEIEEEKIKIQASKDGALGELPPLTDQEKSLLQAPEQQVQGQPQSIVIQMPKAGGKRVVTGPNGQQYTIEEQ